VECRREGGRIDVIREASIEPGPSSPMSPYGSRVLVLVEWVGMFAGEELAEDEAQGKDVRVRPRDAFRKVLR
jgi:hypothetical protein